MSSFAKKGIFKPFDKTRNPVFEENNLITEIVNTAF